MKLRNELIKRHDPDSILEVVSRARKESKRLSAQDCLTAVNRVGRNFPTDRKSKTRLLKDERLRSLLNDTFEHVVDLDPVNLSYSADAFSRIGVQDQVYYDKIQNRAVASIAGFSPKEMSHLIRALAVSRAQMSEDFVSAFCDRALQIRHMFKPKDLSLTLHSLVTAKVRISSSFFSGMCAQARKRCNDFNSIDLTNTLWALASSGNPRVPNVLVSAFCSRALVVMEDFQACHLSSFLWAISKLSTNCSKKFVRAVCLRVDSICSQMNPALLSCTLRSLALMGHAGVVSEAICREAVHKHRWFAPQDISMLLWSLATAEISISPPLSDKMIQQAIRNKDRFQLKEICPLLWALAKAGVGIEPKLLFALGSRVKEQSDQLQVHEIPMVLWALATGFLFSFSISWSNTILSYSHICVLFE